LVIGGLLYAVTGHGIRGVIGPLAEPKNAAPKRKIRGAGIFQHHGRVPNIMRDTLRHPPIPPEQVQKGSRAGRARLPLRTVAQGRG